MATQPHGFVSGPGEGFVVHGDEPTRIVDLPAGRLEHRVVQGSGGVLVVFHGGHARAGLAVGEQALIDAGWTVLVVSRPGYGRTPLSTGPGPEPFAAAVAQLCAHLNITSVHAAVGISAGATAAVAFAALHPRLVRSLVLHSARSALPFPSGATRLVATVAFHSRLEARSWAATAAMVRRFPQRGLQVMLAGLSTLPSRQVLADLSAAEQRHLAGVFAAMRSGGGFTVDVRHRVDASLQTAVTQPSLVVASPHDGQVRWEHAEHLAHSIPHATLWRSPSLSHLIWFGSGASATGHRTEDFLRSVP